MGQAENAISRIGTAFKECLSDTETLRTIDDLFTDLGFEFDPQAEERSLAQSIGQRRSRVAGYLETLDLADPGDRDRLLSVIATKLVEWADGRSPSPDRLTRLHRTLKAVGYEWNGAEIVERTPAARPPRVPDPVPSAPVRLRHPSAPEPPEDAPSAFISYAHEDKDLVHALADALRARGCRIWIDEEGMRVGDVLIERIAEAIDSVEFLLAIVSEASVKSSWCRRELSIAIDGALKTAHVKVLPVRVGSVDLPPTLVGTFSPRVDPSDVEAMADRLIADMESHRKDRSGAGPRPRPAAPPSGRDDSLAAAPVDPPKASPDEPIRILGVDEAGVTRPRNDGTRGSGLHKVPLRLNRRPSARWAEIFRSVWDHPPQFTTMHRPGIASVSGDRIILDGTTMDEIELYHAATLRLVIPETNARVAADEAAALAQRERAEAEQRALDDAVREAAKRITFD